MKQTIYRKTIITITALFSVYAFLVFLMLELESGAPNARIVSVQDGVWYAIATLTTVGYGDLVPVTYGGRMLGFVFLLSSLGIYGYVIGQVTNVMRTVKENKAMGLNGTTFEGHVVIIGWNDFSQSVIGHLNAAGKKVAIITKDKRDIEIIREYYSTDEAYVLYSDFNNFELMEKSNIRKASIVFINLQDDTEKLVYIINIKKHFPGLNYVVTLDNGNLKNTFYHAGVTYAISKNEISSKLLASYIYEPDVALFSEEIIAFAHSDDDYDMKQVQVKEGNPLTGMFYDKAFFDLKKESNVVLIGLVKVVDGKRQMLKNPEGPVKIEKGDYLVLLMDRKGHQRLKHLFHIEEGL
ncbi:MAG: potassium channel family protein [Cyclobacteriaceae bacterium]|nr:NAD-binding protein [Cyclobacteriaceae bacterium]MCB0500226.1 NAD-binding protein [Cyclobacteriaceae bacterium]MCB9237291.1 NAD-binding protein [Flammeovirgaceae bacterium]MCO5271001.1 potassium channel family protein [Cyclobacteriaceae bacterium]MCW5903378.1 NAD-binding protein [Cyclobacteriaceae bacterium]